MSIHHRIILAALTALALGATAIPAYARQFDLNTNGSFVPPRTATSSSTPVPPILPRVKASQITKLDQVEQQAAEHAPPKGARYSDAELNAYGTTATRHTTPGVVTVAAPRVGFAWGDAGIGAAALLVLALLGLGGAIVISGHRPRRSRHTTGLTS